MISVLLPFSFFLGFLVNFFVCFEFDEFGQIKRDSKASKFDSSVFVVAPLISLSLPAKESVSFHDIKTSRGEGEKKIAFTSAGTRTPLRGVIENCKRGGGQ